MTDSVSLLAQCLEWIDQAAGEFMMLGPSDLPALARFTSDLESRATTWDESDAIPAAATTCMRHASGLVKDIILDRASDKNQVLETVGKALDRTRHILEAAANTSGRLTPAAAPVPAPAEPVTGENAATPPTPADWLDDTIIAAYVEQQHAVLPEIEQLILELEKAAKPEHVAALRRLIHTLKGESGVVGAMEIERVCHRLEDYLDDPPEQIATDVLLSTWDWIAKSVACFGNGKPVEGADAMVKAFDAPPPPPATVEPAAPPDRSESVVNAVPDIETNIAVGDIELANDFVAEAQEHFDTADENLLILEKAPDNLDAVGAVFRAFHTIKGVAGFLGLTPIGDLAHVAETLLDEVRKGQRSFSGTAVELTFGALDMLKLMMSDLREALKQEGVLQTRPELPGLLRKLYSLLEEKEPAPEPDLLPPAFAEFTEPEPPPSFERDEGEAAAAPTSTSSQSGGTQTMKVDAARIDQLLDTIGELVIIESIVSGDPQIRALNSLHIEKNLGLLGKITHTLRDMGMSMRMVPVDPVFKKMARLVRDLSRKSGKQVELIIKGGDTEIDKGMVEKLGDPLVHMIRNSMDHGLESAAERVAAGKSPEGRIVLRAHHMGGNIHIDIEDDGRGLNRQAIIDRAIERGLIHSADTMSDQDIYSLIFHAGFSTAKQVTELSGRGVGMDVVKRNIESLRGNVLIRSTPGKGSLFTLVLPLTTAIIDGMLARVGGEIYILPTLSILESFRPGAGQVHIVAGHGEVVSFRNSLLPLFRLSRLLTVKDSEKNPQNAIVMVVEEYGKQWGLMVDDLLGQQQVVIKTLGEGLGRTAGVVGASILADGRPGLILDIADVIRIARGESDTKTASEALQG